MTVKWFDKDTLDCLIRYLVQEVDTVLDIGCGIRPQDFFKPKQHICCEPHAEYIDILKQKADQYPNMTFIQSTALQAVKGMRDKSVDSVFMLDVIEHLGKTDGRKLITECERIAKNQIIIFTPLGFVPQNVERKEIDAWGLHGGEWQVHKAGWLTTDFDDSWTVLACKEYHLTNDKGEPFIPPAGAFWAVKNLGAQTRESQNIDRFPLVSVITPAYNRASYLNETMDSVLNQGYPRVEYIVLDDGSKDNTKEVLEKYTGRVIWETHPNMGETRTVNKGLGMAHGEIVVVVNSDDPLLPGAISAAVAFMHSHPDVLVAYPDWEYIGPKSEVTGHYQVKEYDYLYMVRTHYCTPGPGAFIRRKAVEAAGVRDPEFRYVADFEYWLRLGLYGKFARIPRTLATFRVHPDSASVSQQGSLMSHEHIRLIQKFYERPNLPPEVRKARAEGFYNANVVAAVVCGGDLWAARKYRLKALAYHPSGVFTMATLALFKLVKSPHFPKPLYRILRWGWHVVRPVSKGENRKSSQLAP